ncbi:MAG: class IV adenylate cyclase [Candidatus Hydrogenedentes bacterium]|nr:class IV adenylate cyclase [Candidatus Hydrogenedentota bacterium]
MRNIELKARLGDLKRAAEVCRKLGAVFQTDIRQVDTYFVVASGRLKLRENDPGNCELIHYHRADEASSKASDYKIVQGSPELREMLAAALGVRCVVRKVRGLWLWENVRIHLDTVEGLGTFIEFEAVLGERLDDADGYRKLARLREAFGIGDEDLIERSYVDLMSGGGAGRA